MASYKVAQDVEADDKLIGPFSPRQFGYLSIVAMSIIVAWGLWGIFPPLAIIPLPVILFFGALSWPLRKDQPMETYLAAMISFYLKPRRRLWQPDGVESLVEITAPKQVETRRTKNLSEMEAAKRLAYLADLADTRGWSIRHTTMPSDTSPMQPDIYNEAHATEDPLDDNASIARSFETMIGQADTRRRQAMLERMQHPVATKPTPSITPVSRPAPMSTPTQPQQTPITPAANPSDDNIHFNPYPTMHQSVIQPLSADDQTNTPTSPVVPQTTSETVVSPDIINLAHNSDLSIETIAHEANRIKNKHHDDDGEVVISLR